MIWMINCWVTIGGKHVKRIATCCFTGHRPEKLSISTDVIYNKLKRAIEDAIDDGFTIFITGMAKGVDIWAGELVLEKKKEFSHIKLICAVPFEGFEQSWEIEWQKRYYSILRDADEVNYISQKYFRGVYQVRNEWMIDHSSMVIAGYTGAAGGTRNTIEYAKKQDEYIIRIL